MKVFTTSGDFFEIEPPLPSLDEIKAFITDYELTISSQQSLALFYYKMGNKEDCLEILKYSLKMNIFNTTNSDIIKLTMLAYFIETKSERDEISNLFSQLEKTDFQNELKILKGYYLFSQKKYDTALFCLENDTFARNMIFLSKNEPEKVETNDPFFKGYKFYLENDTEGAIKYFKKEYETNKNVIVYLSRLDENSLSQDSLSQDSLSQDSLSQDMSQIDNISQINMSYDNKSNDNNFYTDLDLVKNSIEFKIKNILLIKDPEERQEKLKKFYEENECIKDEYFYEKGKYLHKKKLYKEALEFYLKSNFILSDYQAKRILGIKFENKYFKDKNLIFLENLKINFNKEEFDILNLFNKLKENKNFIDESTYFNNRGFYLYFIENLSENILNEIKNELKDSLDFSVGPIISYFNKAYLTANDEQKKVIKFNKESLENEENEILNEELENCILNLRNDPDKYLNIFIKYLSGEKGNFNSNILKFIVKGIGICLALKNDKFCEKIFEYLDDKVNLRIFKKNYELSKKDFKV